MSLDFDKVLRNLREQKCPQELSKEVQKVFCTDSNDCAATRWLNTSEPKNMADVLLAVFVCNKGLTLMCNDTMHTDDDAAVHINNKWDAFSSDSLFKYEQQVSEPEHDLSAFEAEIDALCLETDSASAGRDADDYADG